MTFPNKVVNKSRSLVDDVTIAANGALPAFPPLDMNPRVYPGDFQGACIGGFEFLVGALTTITAMNANIEHSNDNVNWYVLKALAQSSGSDSSYTELDDTDPKPMKLLRVAFTATGTYGSAAGVSVRVKFGQPGPRGRLAPPGFNIRRN